MPGWGTIYRDWCEHAYPADEIGTVLGVVVDRWGRRFGASSDDVWSAFQRQTIVCVEEVWSDPRVPYPLTGLTKHNESEVWAVMDGRDWGASALPHELLHVALFGAHNHVHTDWVWRDGSRWPVHVNPEGFPCVWDDRSTVDDCQGGEIEREIASAIALRLPSDRSVD